MTRMPAAAGCSPSTGPRRWPSGRGRSPRTRTCRPSAPGSGPCRRWMSAGCGASRPRRSATWSSRWREDRPRSLIQMATGSGKTFTAANICYRLIKHADAKRILFLVDRSNLGKQAKLEFDKFTIPETQRKFPAEYNVQHLTPQHHRRDRRGSASPPSSASSPSSRARRSWTRRSTSTRSTSCRSPSRSRSATTRPCRPTRST